MPRYWTRANVELIKKYFVPVAVRGGEQSRQDAIGEFIRKTDIKLGLGLKLFLTPSGKLLGRKVGKAGAIIQPGKILYEWNNLPLSERKPGAVQVGEMGPIDTNWALPKPPAGGLILKLHYRFLAREGQGELRHVTAQDFGKNLPPGYKASPGVLKNHTMFYDAQPEFLWLTRTEWQSLLPTRPEKGYQYDVPHAITRRILRYYLIPGNVLSGTLGWNIPDYLRSGKLTLTVEDASADRIRLRVEGFAMLGSPYEKVRDVFERGKLPEGYKFSHHSIGYEPSLLGYIDYDRNDKKITRFDMVALGDAYGMTRSSYHWYRPGRQPLGISFELADPAVPANQVPPHAVIGSGNLQVRRCKVYFGEGLR